MQNNARTRHIGLGMSSGDSGGGGGGSSDKRFLGIKIGAADPFTLMLLAAFGL